MDGTDAAGPTLSGRSRPPRPGLAPPPGGALAGYGRRWRDGGGRWPGGGRVAGIRTGRRSRRRVGSDVAGPVEGEPPIVPGDACRLGLADDPVAAEGEGASGGDHAVRVTGVIVKLHSTSQWAQIAAAS